MNRKEIALDCRDKKYNCAQSVLCAFAADVGLEKDTALKISACFGGGMRCGEVCGAVTGILMAIGMKHGSAAENDEAGKYPAYKKTAEYINRFKEIHGTLLCRELLKTGGKAICEKAILNAVEIGEELIL